MNCSRGNLQIWPTAQCLSCFSYTDGFAVLSTTCEFEKMSFLHFKYIKPINQIKFKYSLFFLEGAMHNRNVSHDCSCFKQPCKSRLGAVINFEALLDVPNNNNNY